MMPPKSSMRNRSIVWLQHGLRALAIGEAITFRTSQAAAQIYTGVGIKEAIDFAKCKTLGGISCEVDIRKVVLDLLATVLDFVTLLGVITVITAGIYMITSNGDEGTKDKAKKIILYTVFGILIILFSRVIVTFIASINHA